MAHRTLLNAIVDGLWPEELIEAMTWRAGRREPLMVAIETDFNLVFVQASVNGSPPLRFLVDTGADVNVLDTGVAADLGLPMGDAASLDQLGGDLVTATIKHPTTISIAGAPVWTVALQAVPVAPLGVHVGRPLHGILGHPAIAEYVMDLDYRAGTMTLSDPVDAQPASTSVPLLIEPTAIDEIATFVTATIGTLDGRSIEGRFKLDTGGTGTLVLAANFARDAGLPTAEQPTLREHGIGAGGLTGMLAFRIASLEVGDQMLHDMAVSVRTSGGFEERPYAGTLGGEILSRFRVVLDYGRHCLGLTPYPGAGDRFPYDAAGITATSAPDSRVVKVIGISDGSPAAGAGLRPGDQITAIDGRAMADIGLAGAWRLFRSGASATHRLLVHREGRDESVDIVLRERI